MSGSHRPLCSRCDRRRRQHASNWSFSWDAPWSLRCVRSLAFRRGSACGIDRCSWFSSPRSRSWSRPPWWCSSRHCKSIWQFDWRKLRNEKYQSLNLKGRRGWLTNTVLARWSDDEMRTVLGVRVHHRNRWHGYVALVIVPHPRNLHSIRQNLVATDSLLSHLNHRGNLETFFLSVQKKLFYFCSRIWSDMAF